MSRAMNALVDESSSVERAPREVLAILDARTQPRVTADKIGALITKQAAAYCGLASAQSLYNLISQGRGPVHFKHGRLNAFYEADLDIWTRKRLSAPGEEKPA